jgi:FkbM family methyltransferase
MSNPRLALYRVIARSRLLSRLALRLRNEAGLIVGLNLAEDFRTEGLERFLAHVGPGLTRFVDVGANVGNWTQQLLRHTTPDVRGLLFEPSASAMDRLRLSLGSDERVELVQEAVSDIDGEVTFFEEADAGEGSSLLASIANVRAIASPVRATTLYSALEERGWSTVDLVKIDAEGFDFHVLRGAEHLLADHRIRLVQFEYNWSWMEAGSTLARARQLLRDHGYELYLMRSGGLYTVPFTRYGEFFSYANFVAVSPEARSMVSPLLSGSL